MHLALFNPQTRTLAISAMHVLIASYYLAPSQIILDEFCRESIWLEFSVIESLKVAGFIPKRGRPSSVK